MLIKNKLDLIGNTPLVYMSNYSKTYKCNIYVKLEKYNLTYSSKDRAVKQILLDAIDKKIINKDSTIIEATSGNTGISLACMCLMLSLKCIIVMSKNVSEERKKLIKSYNGKIIYVDNIKQAKKKAYLLSKEIPNSFLLSQFTNKNNCKAHYENSALEIINDLREIDTFVCSYGSAGSISGIGKRLKEYNSNINSICVIPDNKIHRIEGVYANIKPSLLDKSVIDKVIKVSDVEAYLMQKEIVIKEGLLLGLSSALAIKGALKYIKVNKNIKNIVIFCPDGGERYLSNKYLDDKTITKEDISKDIEYMHKVLFEGKLSDDIFFKYKISINQVKFIKKLLMLDAKAIYDIDPSCESINQVINSYNSFFAIMCYRIAHQIYETIDKILARKISEYALSKTSIDIHPGAKIGKSFAIDHGIGIVIGQTSIIKNNVTLYHGVTLGAKSLECKRKLVGKKRHPTILNNVTIYSNASILGGNTIIGNNCVIGCNKIVSKSIKDNTILR